MWWHAGTDTSSWILMGVAMVVLWSVVIGALAALYRGDCRDSHQRLTPGNPVDQGVETPLSSAGCRADPQSSRRPTSTR